MGRKATNNNDKELPESEQIFRYWVELRDLQNGSTRDLALKAKTRIHIPTKRNEVQKQSEEVLELKDGSLTLEAKSLDDLASQLRQRYPDGAYERTLHRARDCQAEERRAEAMKQLVKILAEAAAEDLLREREGERRNSGAGSRQGG